MTLVAYSWGSPKLMNVLHSGGLLALAKDTNCCCDGAVECCFCTWLDAYHAQGEYDCTTAGKLRITISGGGYSGYVIISPISVFTAPYCRIWSNLSECGDVEQQNLVNYCGFVTDEWRVVCIEGAVTLADSLQLLATGVLSGCSWSTPTLISVVCDEGDGTPGSASLEIVFESSIIGVSCGGVCTGTITFTVTNEDPWPQ